MSREKTDSSGCSANTSRILILSDQRKCDRGPVDTFSASTSSTPPNYFNMHKTSFICINRDNRATWHRAKTKQMDIPEAELL